MRSVVLVGNPKPRSKTLDAARLVARSLTEREPDIIVDLVDLGYSVLEWGNQTVSDSIARVQECELAIVASPTFKATYSGLLKIFLDQFPPNGLEGVTAFPVMLGASPKHALAPELLLKPVLVELGAICPTPGLFLIDSDYADKSVLDPWVERTRAFFPNLAG